MPCTRQIRHYFSQSRHAKNAELGLLYKRIYENRSRLDDPNFAKLVDEGLISAIPQKDPVVTQIKLKSVPKESSDLIDIDHLFSLIKRETEHSTRHRNRRPWSDRRQFHSSTFVRRYVDKQPIKKPQSHTDKFRYELTSAQEKFLQFDHPELLYPKARSMTRTFHLHVGPTNSGKTYTALQSLKKAKAGVYCSPLRLLAHEIYKRFNDEGIKCSLVTGESRSLVEGAGIVSCTVEMASLSNEVDVAVVDEIQLLADERRGWAWTSTVLGLCAKEIHLCGEESSIALVEKLVKSCYDKLEIHRYGRLGPLEIEKESLKSDLTNIRRGDCVIAFSRKDIFAIAHFIRTKMHLNVAIAYGGLPADTRNKQAENFNASNSDIDVLVASDAVGMGLNLNIQRTIFASMQRWNGKEMINLPVAQIKQIAGRAGRYRVHGIEAVVTDDSQKAKSGTVGYVTTLKEEDLPILRAGLEVPIQMHQHAVFQPPDDVYLKWAKMFGTDIPLHQIIYLLYKNARLPEYYKPGDVEQLCEIAFIASKTNDISLERRFSLACAPFDFRSMAFAECLPNVIDSMIDGNGHIDRVIGPENLRTITHGSPAIKNELRGRDMKMLHTYEGIHKLIMAYLWLSVRMRGVFYEPHKANKYLQKVEKIIYDTLNNRRANYGVYASGIRKVSHKTWFELQQK